MGLLGDIEELEKQIAELKNSEAYRKLESENR
jgi:hypothetical protein